MKVKGLNRVLNSIKGKGKEINRKSIDIIDSSLMIGRSVAVQKAPSAFGKLRQGINTKRTNLKGEVFSQMPYSVFVEFGTGKKVRVPVDTPDDLKKSARLMKGRKGGNFDDFLTRLSRWARLKGIPQEAVYPIAVSLLDEGQEPQPFMRPAYIASKRNMLIQLKRL